MTAMTGALGWTLLHFLWQGVLIGTAAALVLSGLRKASPQLRYLVACAAMLACIAWPAAELAARLQAGNTVAGLQTAALRLTAAQNPAWPLAVQQQLPLLVAAWAACIAALSLRTIFGLVWIERAVRRGAQHTIWQSRLQDLALQLGIGRAVRLRIVASLVSPVTAGWWRPVVLVPASLVSGMPPELLQALLAHELAHIRRLDYLVNLLQNVIETLLFYHPVVWWLSRRIRAERELIADDIASAAAGGPRRLALALSELEKLQFAHPRTALAASGGELMQRIGRLLQPAPESKGWRPAVSVFMLAACIVGAGYATAKSPNRPVDIRAVADFSTCEKPWWPKSSLRAGHAGTVTLRFLISETGKVTDSEIANSSGHRALDRAAQIGIGKCTFKPAVRSGEKVASWMQMQYVWIQ